MAKQFTLGKNERLKSRKLIEQLFKEGKSFNAFPFRVYYLLQVVPLTAMPKNSLQFGAGASAKNFKKAVDRNRIKRLAREAYRLQKKIAGRSIENKYKKSFLVFYLYAKRVAGL